ncbi:hypothetical protein SAMN02982927_00063 [Sporolactobacillus nakayamae]|uniref:Uncharacterized protein n=1 Tax=Sporolactobacillus nakayamae TaxID=269670 RepID=A0A1I2MYW3_9BACL|nr:hypothetical protein SAMN02982927_00063 [Sporolactobacillus nakayamae]
MIGYRTFQRYFIFEIVLAKGGLVWKAELIVLRNNFMRKNIS